MTIVGFNFTRLDAEKKAGVQGKIKVANNINIKDVAEEDLSMGAAKEKGLRFVFHFSSKYDPDMGSIDVEGNVLYLDDEKKIKEIIKSWKKDKKVPEDVMQAILNTILMKCNLEAILLSKEVNLPPPIPMPSLGAASTSKKQA